MGDDELPYGIKNGVPVHISDVERGLACGCVCYKCQGKLVAKKGLKRAYHFAHDSKNKTCKGSLESVLHLVSKNIIDKHRRIIVPEITLEFNSKRKPLIIAEQSTYTIDKTYIENKQGEIRPDLRLEIGGKNLIVEIFVTHKVDSSKLEKIKKMGISAIEIDLSKESRDISMPMLTRLVIDEAKNKRWINSERANRVYEILMENTIRKEVFHEYGIGKLRQCPKKTHNRSIQNHNNVDLHECITCQYCLDSTSKFISEIEFIRCIGHNPEMIDCYIT
jgi:hypothetical protein